MDLTLRTPKEPLQGDERGRIYDEQRVDTRGFADYAKRPAGIRTIPVLKVQTGPGDHSTH
jgi:hypothetical protein